MSTHRLGQKVPPQGAFLKLNTYLGVIYVDIKKVECVIARQRLLEVYVSDRERPYFAIASLIEFLSQNKDEFVRLHRNAVVRSSQIDSLRRLPNGKSMQCANGFARKRTSYVVALKNGMQIAVSQLVGESNILARTSRKQVICITCGNPINPNADQFV